MIVPRENICFEGTRLVWKAGACVMALKAVTVLYVNNYTKLGGVVMHYCNKCRERWNWPEQLQGLIINCGVCGERTNCQSMPAHKLPLPDHRRLQVLTQEELPKEWSDCVRVSAAISDEIEDMIKEMAVMQEAARKHIEYIRAVNNLYFSEELVGG